MRFSQQQEKIIKLIADGEVDDIETFIKYWYKDCIFQYDREAIIKKKQADYQQRKDEVDPYAESFLGKNHIDFQSGGMYMGDDYKFHPKPFNTHQYSEADVQRIKRDLSDYSLNDDSFSFKYKLHDTIHTIDTLNHPVYLIDDDQPILEFMYIIDYLAEEHLVLVKTQPEISDLELFFKTASMQKRPADISHDIIDHAIKNDALEKIQELTAIPKNRYIFKDKDIDYADKKICINETLIERCQEYLDKQIIVTHKIIDFLNRNFSSFEEYSFKKQTKLTWIAIISSIALSIVSIIVSIVLALSNNDWEKVESNNQARFNQEIELVKDIKTLIEDNSQTNNPLVENSQEITIKLDRIIEILENPTE